MDNTQNEHIFFSIDDKDIQDTQENNQNNEEPDKLSLLLNEINNYDFVNQTNNLFNKDIFETMCYGYKINYTVKELLLICDYYGIAKEMKVNKYNKDEIINVLVQFENNPINNDIFMRRQSMWYYVEQLKNDKFMKKYVLW